MVEHIEEREEGQRKASREPGLTPIRSPGSKAALETQSAGGRQGSVSRKTGRIVDSEGFGHCRQAVTRRSAVPAVVSDPNSD